MRMEFEGKNFTLVINQEKQKGDTVTHIDMESGMIEKMSFEKNGDGETTILRIEGREALDDLIAALTKFKQMDF